MGTGASYNRFLQTRNRRRLRSKSRRATKRSRRSCRRRQQGGSWAYRIPDEAVVGRTSDEGVQGFKTMEEVRQENDMF